MYINLCRFYAFYNSLIKKKGKIVFVNLSGVLSIWRRPLAFLSSFHSFLANRTHSLQKIYSARIASWKIDFVVIIQMCNLQACTSIFTVAIVLEIRSMEPHQISSGDSIEWNIEIRLVCLCICLTLWSTTLFPGFFPFVAWPLVRLALLLVLAATVVCFSRSKPICKPKICQIE